MRVVLGIDAAWTADQPSGVALLVENRGQWNCCGLAPSYSAFAAMASGTAVNWSEKANRGTPEPGALLQAAARLAGSEVDVVAIDMPVSKLAIRGRRVADDRISREYGGRHASTHSPSSARPGGLSDRLRQQFEELGYDLAVAPQTSSGRALIEVYPHVALIELLGAPRRLECKVSKTGKYWPNEPKSVRIANLLAVWRRILIALREHVHAINLALPAEDQCHSLSSLKPFEDALDAAVSAWVGTLFVEGRAVAYGDESAAIWAPVPDRSQGREAGSIETGVLETKPAAASDIGHLRDRLRSFATERDWDQFHTPKNLAMALSVEVAELVEHFQWLTAEQSQALEPEVLGKVRAEIGDVLIYLVRLGDKLGIDLLSAASDKLIENERKYPTDKVRGKSKKYDQY